MTVPKLLFLFFFSESCLPTVLPTWDDSAYPPAVRLMHLSKTSSPSMVLSTRTFTCFSHKNSHITKAKCLNKTEFMQPEIPPGQLLPPFIVFFQLHPLLLLYLSFGSKTVLPNSGPPDRRIVKCFQKS